MEDIRTTVLELRINNLQDITGIKCKTQETAVSKIRPSITTGIRSKCSNCKIRNTIIGKPVSEAPGAARFTYDMTSR
jgi:hypothetical protein